MAEDEWRKLEQKADEEQQQQQRQKVAPIKLSKVEMKAPLKTNELPQENVAEEQVTTESPAINQVQKEISTTVIVPEKLIQTTTLAEDKSTESVTITPNVQDIITTTQLQEEMVVMDQVKTTEEPKKEVSVSERSKASVAIKTIPAVLKISGE